MNELPEEILLGNVAIARGLVENGCRVVTAYPGTPSSEILPGVVEFKQRLNLDIYTEWSVNEKIAFEVALAASYSGKRAAVAMKQVGLNVASDPLMSSAYTGVKGGFLIISADDPGPHSSQTEQDTRLLSMLAKVPAFDPSSAQEAKDMVKLAFELSEKYEIPVILRPVLRVCHSKQNIRFAPITHLKSNAKFIKDPTRWAATPRYRFKLHKRLNEKLKEIEADSELISSLNFSINNNQERYPFGIIAAGIPFTIVQDILSETGLEVPVLKIGLPYPLPHNLVEPFIDKCDTVLVLEETYPVIEYQIIDKRKVLGRLTGTIPSEGELLPGIISGILAPFIKDHFYIEIPEQIDSNLNVALHAMDLPARKPTLCPGCPHRATFYAIRKALPKAIYTSDIGCYTLGLNLKAVDTVLDMGAAINLAAGFYQTYYQDGIKKPVVATIGDSTFYHAGPSALINAVYNGARFILVVLDNEVTAMTGMQPTPGSGHSMMGNHGRRVSIEEILRGCGIEYIREINPYNVENMIDLVKDAEQFTCGEDGGIAAIIARYPCVIYDKSRLESDPVEVTVTEECTGCLLCLKNFECPALVLADETSKVYIDRRICVDCGVCIESCPFDAIVGVKEEAWNLEQEL